MDEVEIKENKEKVENKTLIQRQGKKIFLILMISIAVFILSFFIFNHFNIFSSLLSPSQKSIPVQNAGEDLINGGINSLDTSSSNALDTKDILSINGITGIKEIRTTITSDGVSKVINKSDYSDADLNFSTTTSRAGLKYKSKSDGVKVENFLINNKLSRQNIEAVKEGYIDYKEIMWNGSIFDLSKYSVDKPLILRGWNYTDEITKKKTDKIIMPNVITDLYSKDCFNGTRPCYKRISTLEEVSQGAYLIFWNDDEGKGSYFNLTMPTKSLDAGSIAKIDPTYYNQTDGFSVAVNCPNPNGITGDNTTIWVAATVNKIICIYNVSTRNYISNFSLQNFSGPVGGIRKNGSSVYSVDVSTTSPPKYFYEHNYSGYLLNNFTTPIPNAMSSLEIFPKSVELSGGQPSGFFIGRYQTEKRVYLINTTGQLNKTGYNNFTTFNFNIGMDGNDTDIWYMDGLCNLSHLNYSKDLVDSQDLCSIGIAISRNLFINTTSSPTNILIADAGDNFVYDLGLTDVFPPTVTITTPLNRTYTSLNNLNVNYSWTDESSTSNCWWTNDSGQNNNSLASCSTNITGVTWINGMNNITVYVNDTGGNIGSSSISFFVNSSTDLDDCYVLKDGNKIYNLIKNVSSAGTCFTILANNITLVGNGYWVNYSYSGTLGYGIYNSGFNQTNVTGIKVTEGSSSSKSGGYGIVLSNSYNSFIQNSTSMVLSSTNFQAFASSINNNVTLIEDTAILLGSSTDTNCRCFKDVKVVKNSICNITYAGGGTGYDASTPNNIKVENNLFYLKYRLSGNANSINLSFINNTVMYNLTEVSFSNGQDFSNISYNTISSYNDIFPYIEITGTIISNNIFKVYGNGIGCYKMRLSGATVGVYNSSFVAENCFTNGTNSYGISFGYFSNNNTFRSVNITTTGSKSYAISYQAGGISNNYSVFDSYLTSNSSHFELNVSYTRNGEFNYTNVTRANGDPINITWSSNSNGTLNMMWYFNVNVTNTLGDTSLSDANVTITDALGNVLGSFNTSSEGNISRQILMSYKRNETGGTNYTYFYPYNITVSRYGYGLYQNSSVNLTNNLILTINMPSGDTSYPIFSNYVSNNNSIYRNGLATFNVTLSNTNGTVWLTWINGTNYTAINTSDFPDIFSVNFYPLINGTYTYNWSSYGNGTNNLFNTSDNLYYTILDDLTVPNVTIDFPTNNAILNNLTQDLNFSFSDNVGISSCWYYNATELDQVNYTISPCANLSQLTWKDGVNNVTICVNDTSNNENCSSVGFTITDNIYPIFSNYWDNGGTLTGNAVLNVTVANSNGTVYLTFNSTEYKANLVGSYYTYTVSSLPAGTYEYNWTSWGTGYNHNKNISDNRSYSATPDTTPPTFTNLANKTKYVGTELSYLITATDISGVDTFTISGVSAGNYSITRNGLLTNATAIINPELQKINVTVNDTLNNAIKGQIFINWTALPAATTTVVKNHFGYNYLNGEKLSYNWWN